MYNTEIFCKKCKKRIARYDIKGRNNYHLYYFCPFCGSGDIEFRDWSPDL